LLVYWLIRISVKST